MITLHPCKVSIVKRENLLQAIQVSLIAAHRSLHVAQQLFLSRARREKDFLTLSAEERYRLLFGERPQRSVANTWEQNSELSWDQARKFK